jgi:uncharacterized protein YutE (UPF0331/DUF86 family)
MDLFERQAQLQELFIASPVNAAYAQGSTTARQIAGHYNDLGIAVLLLDQVKPNEFFDYQMYLMGELVKRLETPQLDVVILNNASLMQRFNVIRTYQLLYQRDQKGRVAWEMRAVMDWLDFKKYDEVQSKALAERIRGDRFAIDAEYVRKRLQRLREYSDLLRGFSGISREKFRAEPNLYALAQWYLTQAVELCFGTGVYFISALGLERPEAYHDILDVISKHGIVEKNLAYRLETLANMRNLLAFDKELSDIDEVYGLIQTRLDDLELFAKEIEAYLAPENRAE